MNDDLTSQSDGINNGSLSNQGSAQQILRDYRLVLSGLFIIIGLVFVRQLINPIRTHNWLEIAIVSFLFLVTLGLIIGLLFIYFRLSSIYQDKENHIRQQNLQRILTEKTFTQQTEKLQKHIEQYKVISQILLFINDFPDEQSFSDQLINLFKSKLNLYYAGIFVIDEQGKNAWLKAGSGEAGQKMRSANFALALDSSSMVGWSIVNKKPRFALDVTNETVRYQNPDLPLTRSELAFPLLSRGIVLGALSFQSASPDAFDEEDIAIFQSIADLVATALDKMDLVHDMQKKDEEINALNQKYLESAWNEELRTNPNLSYTYEKGLSISIDKSQNTYKVPMTLRGQTLGYLDLNTEGQVISSDEKALIETILNQTAISLENARLLEESQKQINQEHYLTDLTTKFSRALDIDQILNIALRELGKLPLVSEVSVYIKSPDTGSLDSQVLSSEGEGNA